MQFKSFQIVPAVQANVTTGYFQATEEYANNQASSATAGSSFVDRNLNTVRTNTIAGVSLANKQITLPAGTYRVFGVLNGMPTGTAIRAFVKNVTDNSIILAGLNAYTNGSYPDMVTSIVSGRFTLLDTKVISLQHYCGNANSTHGSNSGAGTNEVFSSLEIWKEIP